jgi:hypothetical protein
MSPWFTNLSTRLDYLPLMLPGEEAHEHIVNVMNAKMKELLDTVGRRLGCNLLEVL